MGLPPDGRRRRRGVLGSIVRVGLVTATLCAVYANAPLDRPLNGGVGLRMALSLLVLAALVAWQVVAVSRSPHPGLRAVEAVAVTVPLLILMFASAYVVMSSADGESFTQALTRTDAVYFAVTVLATVGFGDIAPKTAAARVVVTVQMLADLVLIGVIARVLFGAAQQRRQTLIASAALADDEGSQG
jgi:voltage-gated potassium channel